MRRVLTTPCERKIPPGTEGNHFYLLLFDGGPRGNPGPGGSGTVVAKVARGTGVYTICWVSSMSYASRTTTNNIAENMGLLMGLRARHRNWWTPMQVIGDCRIIIHQQKTRTLPKATHLTSLYRRSRRLADMLNVTGWNHHRRAHNKMADALANMAVDSRRSVQRHIMGIDSVTS
ncbi:hypothetical protein JG688_00014758 [Phytophthora aleatoria]|uniref:RNase H type-1 domain-containing protein n=1 Tax=Phytophthora aleatoria TaxID=2496075 RepID=A0A8J5I7B4_9STRA|nr:hypothetical protein JG688_00014758 [Phytophthora aleatoria]